MTNRDGIVLTVVVAAVLIGAFWFLVLGPQRGKASKLGTQVTQAKQQLASAESDAAESLAARAQYSHNYATVAQLGKAVPASDDVPSLVYQLSSTAQATGVDFRTIKLQNSASGAAAATPAPASGSSGSGGSGASGGAGASNGSGAAPAAASQAATATLPPGAVVGPAGFPTMPFSFTFEGSFFRLGTFFARLENLIHSKRGNLSVSGRLLTIDGLALTAGGQGFPPYEGCRSGDRLPAAR